MKKLLIICMIPLFLAMAFMACDETTTEPGSGTVTFNLSVPPYEDVSGATVAVSLWSQWQDNTPVIIEDGVFSGNSLTLSLTNVQGGTYIAVAAIDVDGNGLPSDGPADEGDVFWAALDVVVNGDQTINVSQWGWQYIETGAIIIGVKGIPNGHDGDVFALGIFEDGIDIYAEAEIEPIMGGMGLVYNNSAVITAMYDGFGDSLDYELPTDNYDIWMLVDVDGTPQDWNDTTGGLGNPITNGDFVASYDYSHNSTNYDAPLITASFTEVQTFNVTFNITAPIGEDLEGHGVLATIWSDFEQDGPISADSTVISSGTATVYVPAFATGAYSVAVFIDNNGSGFAWEDGPVDPGDLFWGAIDVAVTAGMTIDVLEDYWQYYHSIVVGVENIPAGHDGEVMSVGLLPAGDNPFSPYFDNGMGGAGLIYNSSAIIALSPMNEHDSTWTLPYGEYEIWCLVDADGALDDYHNMNDSTMFNPCTEGDYYTKYEYSYSSDYQSDEFIHVAGTFSAVVGISGTLSCPDWNSDGGDTYVYLFQENPLYSDSIDTYSASILSAPGSYWLPCLPGDSVYAIGFWDTDNSGEYDGPSQNDLIGGFGVSVDTLEWIVCGESGTIGINFVLDTPFDSLQYSDGP